MPTGQVIINSAFSAIGILEQGGTPSVSDSVDALAELNAMWDAWGIDDGLIYAILASRFALTASIATYTIGQADSSLPQPNFSAPRPGKIFRASITQASGGAISTNALYDGGTGYAVSDTGIILGGNGTVATYVVTAVSAGVVTTYTVSGAGTGYTPMKGAATLIAGAQPGVGSGLRITITTVTAGGQNRNNLKIIEAGTYYAHNDLSAAGAVPDELYPDYNVNVDGFATLYLYPVPLVLAASNLELEAGVNFTAWTLVDTYQIPQGFQDAIQKALAYRLLTFFGAAVAPEVAQRIEQEAMKAEGRIRQMNAYNRQIPPPAAPAPAAA